MLKIELPGLAPHLSSCSHLHFSQPVIRCGTKLYEPCKAAFQLLRGYNSSLIVTMTAK